MNVNVRECGTPMEEFKTFHNVKTIHVTPNIIWIEEYNREPLYVVDRIEEVTQVKSLLSF